MLASMQERFERIEPAVQAYIPEENRFERLFTAAKALQATYPQPDSRPPLYGILLGVKDIFHADGFVTRAGTAVPSDLLAGEEATVITQLKQAGALIAGKTVTTEFAYFEPGPTRNPHNLAHTPGGSSSGSAAAVASGLAHLATGTQTVGSVIRPAGYCGTVGYKPSFDRIATAGLIYFSPSVDHVGLFTQDVEGMILVASVVVDGWDASVRSAEKPVLGIPDDAYLQQVTALTAFEKQVKKLEEAGYTIERVPLFDNPTALSELHSDMIGAELAAGHKQWFAEYEHLYRERTANLIRYGKTVTADRLKQGRDNREILREHIHRVMRENGISAWISPSAPDVAPEGIGATGNPAMNLPWTHAGVPAVSIPAGYGEHNLPLGLQVCGGFGEDEQVLAWSNDIASVLS